MKKITIENKGWGALTIHEEKLPKALLEFKARNELEVWVLGSMTDCYDLMACKAVEYAQSIGLKASDLRLQYPSHGRRGLTTETKRLF